MPPIRESRSAARTSGQLSDADSKGRHNTRALGRLQAGADRFLTITGAIDFAAGIGPFGCGKPRKALAVCHLHRWPSGAKSGESSDSPGPVAPIHLPAR
jgi:hypothetical protein